MPINTGEQVTGYMEMGTLDEQQILALMLDKIAKILRSDCLAFYLAIIPVVLVMMGVSPFVVGPISFGRSFGRTGTLSVEDSMVFIKWAIVVFPFAVAVLWIRLRIVWYVIYKGKTVCGEIKGLWFLRDRGRIVFTYLVGDRRLTKANSVMKFSKTKRLKVGDKVVVCYDPVHPLRAFVREVFV